MHTLLPYFICPVFFFLFLFLPVFELIGYLFVLFCAYCLYIPYLFLSFLCLLWVQHIPLIHHSPCLNNILLHVKCYKLIALQLRLLLLFSCSVCPILCNPMNCSRQAPLSMGILQAKILEWLAIPSSRGSSRFRD